MSVKEFWNRLVKDVEVGSLRSGVTEKKVATVEKKLGFPLPPEMRELYGLCDGLSHALENKMRSIFTFADFLPLDEKSQTSALQEYNAMASLFSSIPYEMEGEEFSAEDAKLWVPIASNFSGSLLLIDCNPTANGKSRVIKLDHDSLVQLSEVAESVEAFLQQEIEAVSTRPEDDDENEDTEQNDADGMLEAVVSDIAQKLMEIEVALVDIATRPRNVPIQTATMREMHLALQVLPSSEPDREVCLAIYDSRRPSVKIAATPALTPDEPISIDNFYFIDEEPAEGESSFVDEVKVKIGVQTHQVLRVTFRSRKPFSDKAKFQFQLLRRVTPG